jgi:hypothetical protein
VDHRAFARVLAMHVEALGITANVEAMKAENAHRLDCGKAQAYGDEAFRTMADSLLFLADQMRGVAGE